MNEKVLLCFLTLRRHQDRIEPKQKQKSGIFFFTKDGASAADTYPTSSGPYPTTFLTSPINNASRSGVQITIIGKEYYFMKTCTVYIPH